MDVVVRIADMQLSSETGSRLITHALGSCIGMTAYDPVSKVGGMIHYMLPQAESSPAKAAATPAMFADTGIPALFRELTARGALLKRLVIKAAGGACLMDAHKVFNIGERNVTILRKILWQNSLMLKGQQVGGAVPRTLILNIDSGIVIVRSNGTECEL